jgi:hypothetical protein
MILIDLFRENFIRQSFLHHYNISSILVKLFDYFPLYMRTFVFDVEMVMDPISRDLVIILNDYENGAKRKVVWYFPVSLCVLFYKL